MANDEDTPEQVSPPDPTPAAGEPARLDQAVLAAHAEVERAMAEAERAVQEAVAGGSPETQ